jgi:hypothetical protein
MSARSRKLAATELALGDRLAMLLGRLEAIKFLPGTTTVHGRQVILFCDINGDISKLAGADPRPIKPAKRAKAKRPNKVISNR